jgi:hypothetical protein
MVFLHMDWRFIPSCISRTVTQNMGLADWNFALGFVLFNYRISAYNVQVSKLWSNVFCEYRFAILQSVLKEMPSLWTSKMEQI